MSLSFDATQVYWQARHVFCRALDLAVDTKSGPCRTASDRRLKRSNSPSPPFTKSTSHQVPFSAQPPRVAIAFAKANSTSESRSFSFSPFLASSVKFSVVVPRFHSTIPHVLPFMQFVQFVA